MEGVEISNFQCFRDCFASLLIEKSAQELSRKGRKARQNGQRKMAIKPAPQEPTDAEELAEFTDVSATAMKP